MLSTRVVVLDIAGRRLEKDPVKFAEAACSLAQKRKRQQAVLIGTALANIAALTAMFSDAAAGNTKASQALNRKVETQRKHANKASSLNRFSSASSCLVRLSRLLLSLHEIVVP